MGDGAVVSNPTRHEHELRFTERLDAYECRGCKGRGVNTGYKCRSCPEFVLHETCAAAPDERDHPFFPRTTFRFRPNTHVRHDCDACGVLIRGFLFQSEDRWRFHPLCLNLPLQFEHSGHGHGNLQLFNQEGGRYSCAHCGKENTNWYYRCRTVTCRARLDMNCALIDMHDLSQHGVTEVYKPSKTRHVLNMVGTAAIGVASLVLGGLVTTGVGEASDALTNRGRDEEGRDDGGESREGRRPQQA